MDEIDAIFECLRTLNAKPGEPVNIYAIGAPLIDSGLDPDAIIDGLYSLEARKIIELLPGNQIVLLRAVPTSTEI